MGRLVMKVKSEVFTVEERIKETILGINGIKQILDSFDKTYLIEHEDDGKDYIYELKATNLFSYVAPEIFYHACTTVKLNGMDDNEIDSMTEEEVKTKLKSIRDTALWWACQEDDDRCWLDDIKVLKSILPHGSVNFSMPDDLTFLGECIRYKRTRCPKNPKIHEW